MSPQTTASPTRPLSQQYRELSEDERLKLLQKALEDQAFREELTDELSSDELLQEKIIDMLQNDEYFKESIQTEILESIRMRFDSEEIDEMFESHQGLLPYLAMYGVFPHEEVNLDQLQQTQVNEIEQNIYRPFLKWASVGLGILGLLFIIKASILAVPLILSALLAAWGWYIYKE